MNQDELIGKCRLTDEEMADYVKTLYQLGTAVEIKERLEAQLRKALPIIQKAERERIKEFMRENGIDFWLTDWRTGKPKAFKHVSDYAFWQALKGEGDGGRGTG